MVLWFSGGLGLLCPLPVLLHQNRKGIWSGEGSGQKNSFYYFFFFFFFFFFCKDKLWDRNIAINMLLCLCVFS